MQDSPCKSIYKGHTVHYFEFIIINPITISGTGGNKLFCWQKQSTVGVLMRNLDLGFVFHSLLWENLWKLEVKYVLETPSVWADESRDLYRLQFN